MIIKTKKELRSVLNYELMRRGEPQVNSWLGWLFSDLKFWLHPGNPTMYTYCLRYEEYYLNRPGLGGGK